MNKLSAYQIDMIQVGKDLYGPVAYSIIDYKDNHIEVSYYDPEEALITTQDIPYVKQ